MDNLVKVLTEYNSISAVVRLALALVCGGIIGIDRGRKRRPAGFRTHMIVCVGAALTMLISQHLYARGYTTDISRLGAQVVSGIGFLGAGTIIVTGRQQVKGMTTAAGLWASACMGLCIGAGFYLASVICCVCIIFTVVVFSKLERIILSRARNINLYVELEDLDGLSSVIEKIKEQDTRIFDVEITKGKYSENHYPNAIFTLQLPKKKSHTALLTVIAEVDAVRSIEEL